MSNRLEQFRLYREKMNERYWREASADQSLLCSGYTHYEAGAARSHQRDVGVVASLV